ncbi:AraC family transcriptional regulator [Mycolicibacterium arenosum]|uniref:Helix-turn-helix domain-containing protein n=1 Tax=Mycolicibacterium arenosum TaxID=2952157 RepID=A0ABT1LYB3_9MYCO|nr:helix-turn-helix domain-containing protein [Mycolicibacterium sp. CAU 1645]MCP9271034.1 helix-turn-helix domain-containing protein [Mycolicibacterium sp. CAU 1645]
MDDTSGEPQLGLVGRGRTGELFDLARWAPSDGAARWIEHFWSVTWDLRGKPAFDSTVITFPSMHLTREWGTDSPRHGHPLPASLLHGVVDHVFTTTLSEAGAVVGCRFRPGGFAARFDRTAGEYTGRVVPVDDELFGAPVDFVDDVTLTAARMDDAVAAHRADEPAAYPELLRLMDRIRDDAGIRRVADVMTHSPWSTRTTQRVFTSFVGVPVEWVVRRYRLQHAALELETNPDVDGAGLAVRLGWYDQAHFINDFRAMLGCTPGEYAARHS